MTNLWKRLAAVATLVAATGGGVAVMALPASASVQQFTGEGAAPLKGEAHNLALADAYDQASFEGFTAGQCHQYQVPDYIAPHTGNPGVTDDDWEAFVYLECTN